MNLCYIEKRFDYLELLNKFVKSNVNIMGIKCTEELKSDDLLIISNKDPDYEELIKKVPNAFIWEKIYEDVHIYSRDRYAANYDFYHLKYSLERALKPEIEAIAVGSSYALFGIEESELNTPCVNLALASQDIYYACLIGRHVINQNSNIKKIFIGTGYYTFYSDLSLTQGGELMRLTDIYYPIFRDKHNCQELLKSEIPVLFEHEIFDMEQITEICCKELFEEFNGKYFTGTKDRFKSRVVIRGIPDTKWYELSDTLQEEAAYERANSHNKAIRYIDSYKENIKILNSFTTFCNERNVRVYLLAFPNTEFYKKYLLKEYKETYMSALNSINGEIRFIDLNNCDIFEDKDFVDMDHLDKSGAIKVSEYINNINL
ncbi:hypothetical protein [Clostridium sp. LS]|uniref:hypothetical protein n=1 Tax=Clostridium sp. LS TaxID=1352601 RepID=UPI000C177112|nr:hypothetical protein [Clostridium sp. LS]